jgi:hypothetical protein
MGARAVAGAGVALMAVAVALSVVEHAGQGVLGRGGVERQARVESAASRGQGSAAPARPAAPRSPAPSPSQAPAPAPSAPGPQGVQGAEPVPAASPLLLAASLSGPLRGTFAGTEWVEVRDVSVSRLGDGRVEVSMLAIPEDRCGSGCVGEDISGLGVDVDGTYLVGPDGARYPVDAVEGLFALRGNDAVRMGPRSALNVPQRASVVFAAVPPGVGTVQVMWTWRWRLASVTVNNGWATLNGPLAGVRQFTLALPPVGGSAGSLSVSQDTRGARPR